jgi:hypothetical protein
MLLNRGSPTSAPVMRWTKVGIRSGQCSGTVFKKIHILLKIYVHLIYTNKVNIHA